MSHSVQIHLSDDEMSKVVDSIQANLTSQIHAQGITTPTISTGDICKAIPVVVLVLQAVADALGPVGKVSVGVVITLVQSWSKKHCPA